MTTSEPSPHASGHHNFINDTASRTQRPTDGRRDVSLSIGFILLRADAWVSEAQKQRRHTQRLETAGDRRSSNGCCRTRNLRRSKFVTCCFWRRRLNRSGSISCGYSFGSIGTADLSSPENGLAHHCGSMSHYRTTSSHYTTTDDVSSDNQRGAPTECPACDSRNITAENGIWHCGFCGASGRCRGDQQ